MQIISYSLYSQYKQFEIEHYMQEFEILFPHSPSLHSNPQLVFYVPKK